MNQINHGGNIGYYAKKYDISPNLIMDFSANINPLGPKESTLRIISEQIYQIKHYPETDSESLKKIAADTLNLCEENIIFGNGATELLFLLMHYKKPANVYIPYPTFSEYELAAKAVQANIHFFPLTDNFQKADWRFLENIESGSIIFICNPNNPTGSLFSKETLKEVTSAAKEKNAFVMIDESFIDFLEESNSMRTEIKNNPNIIILYSLTKIYSIPGLRLGMMMADPLLIKELHKIKDPWNVNCLAQLITKDLLEDRDFIINTKAYFYKERKRMVDALQKVPDLILYPPSANYIFAEITGLQTASELQEYLIQHKIMIRNCSNYQGLTDKYFRIAIKNDDENDVLIKHISDFFTKKK